MVENERDLIILACALSSAGSPSEGRAGGKERPIDDAVMTGYSLERSFLP
jgi:hypothetical protein